MVTILRIAFKVIAILLVTLALLPFHAIALLVGHPASRRIPVLWHRSACRIAGIRVHPRGAPYRKRPLLLIANHVSWKDILVLGSLSEVTFVAKSEVRGWPVFGWLARLQRCIFVDRENRREAGGQASEMAGRLKAGEIVVLFPEGTTSDGNRVLPFKTALFGAATAALPHVDGQAVFIQPVALAYTGVHGMAMGRYHRPIASWPGQVELAPHLLGVLREGAFEVDVVFGEPVRFDATSDRKKTARLVEAEIRATLGRALRGRLDE